MSGIRLEVGSVQESIAIATYNKRAEIDFLKTMAIINAIITVGNGIISAASGGESKGSDIINKNIDALKEMMLPQYAEEKKDKAKWARAILEREMKGGPLKVKVMSNKRASRK